MGDTIPRPIEDMVQETFFCDFHHPAVRCLAEEVGRDAGTPAALATAAFRAVRERIRFGFDRWQVKASETLEKGFGMCSNKALVFVAVLRYHGVPSRLAWVPVRREALRPAWGAALPLSPRRLRHVIAEVHLEGRWIPVDLTLDRRTYDTLFRTRGVTWDIEWDGAGACLLFREHLTGPVISYTVIDEALKENAGNRVPPDWLADLLCDRLNKALENRIRRGPFRP